MIGIIRETYETTMLNTHLLPLIRYNLITSLPVECIRSPASTYVFLENLLSLHYKQKSIRALGVSINIAARTTKKSIQGVDKLAD